MAEVFSKVEETIPALVVHYDRANVSVHVYYTVAHELWELVDLVDVDYEATECRLKG